MAASDSLSNNDKDFLAACEELFKDRYTEKDEEFMKVHKAEPCEPPIIESWYVSQNSGRRNDRRFNNRHQPYSRQGHRSGYGEYNRGHNDRAYGHQSHYSR